MNSAISRLVVALCSLALVACTTVRTVTDQSAVAPPQRTRLPPTVGINDLVTVTTVDGNVRTLRVGAISEDALDGVAEGSAQASHVLVEQIAKIERREFSGLKTALLVIALVGLAYMVAEALATATLASQL